jgi:hypothetical protein
MITAGTRLGHDQDPGPATPPDKHTQHAPMIEVVWSKIHGLGVEVASCCWYAISESASEGTCDILTHAERFVRSKWSQISSESRLTASSGFEPT